MCAATQSGIYFAELPAVTTAEGYTNFNLSVPATDSYNISIYSGGGTEIPLASDVKLDAGNYTLQFYNKTYKGVFYLKVERVDDYKMIACVLK